MTDSAPTAPPSGGSTDADEFVGAGKPCADWLALKDDLIPQLEAVVADGTTPALVYQEHAADLRAIAGQTHPGFGAGAARIGELVRDEAGKAADLASAYMGVLGGVNGENLVRAQSERFLAAGTAVQDFCQSVP